LRARPTHFRSRLLGSNPPASQDAVPELRSEYEKDKTMVNHWSSFPSVNESTRCRREAVKEADDLADGLHGGKRSDIARVEGAAARLAAHGGELLGEVRVRDNGSRDCKTSVLQP
jgi:hypothetical protein